MLSVPTRLCSAAWLEPGHPDRLGATLAIVAKVLKYFVEQGWWECKRWGVFIDFISLHQHPDPLNDKFRPEAEDALFRRGLGSLATVYAHQYTWVLRLTKAPEGYPEQYTLPPGANAAAYMDRGWCFCETSWASMTKNGRMCLDLGLFTGSKSNILDMIGECVLGGGRRAPLTPERFEEELGKKSFTNGSTDSPLVNRLYKEAYYQEFGKAEVLGYFNLGWGDEEAAAVVAVMKSGVMTSLEVRSHLVLAPRASPPEVWRARSPRLCGRSVLAAALAQRQSDWGRGGLGPRRRAV